MRDGSIHLLCTADLHLGRHPARIPEEHDGRGFSPASVWENLVERALRKGVDAVLIAGDIVDRKNCYYEAFGPFVSGVKELGKENIPVFAVAGNHDCELLPRLERGMRGVPFSLLGAGGEWECASLKRDGKPLLNIVGWSYPQRRVRRGPLRDFERPGDGVPAVGLVHSEIGSPTSNYAPVTMDELGETRISGWVVGHIHRPGILARDSCFVLQPGSPQPLAPGEEGTHGVWEVKLHPSAVPDIELTPLATLQYAALELDVAELQEVEELPGRIAKKAEKKLTAAPIQSATGPELAGAEPGWSPELMLLRLILRGRTGLYRELERQRERLAAELELKSGGSVVRIEQIENYTRPAVDIDSLAGGDSLIGLLAGYIKRLEAGDCSGLPRELIVEAERRMRTVYNSNPYQPLRRQGQVAPPDRGQVLSVLKRQAWLLMDALLAQREGIE